MKYRILLVLTVLCIMFSMAACKKNQNTGNGNSNNTDSESVATTLDKETAAEGTTEYVPSEVEENITIELPEDGTFTGH